MCHFNVTNDAVSSKRGLLVLSYVNIKARCFIQKFVGFFSWCYTVNATLPCLAQKCITTVGIYF